MWECFRRIWSKQIDQIMIISIIVLSLLHTVIVLFILMMLFLIINSNQLNLLYRVLFAFRKIYFVKIVYNFNVEVQLRAFIDAIRSNMILNCSRHVFCAHSRTILSHLSAIGWTKNPFSTLASVLFFSVRLMSAKKESKCHTLL